MKGFAWILLRNWKLKLGSVLASLVLAGYVHYTRNVRRTLHVRVDRPALVEGLVFAGKLPSFLDVTFYGPEEEINFEASEFKILLRLSNPRPEPGRDNVFRTQLFPELPRGITAKYTNEIKVNLDHRLVRELPIIARLRPELAKKLQIGYTTVQPTTVRLVGPYQIMAELDHVNTLSVSILDRSLIQEEVFLDGLPEFVELDEGAGDLVRLSVEVYKNNPVDQIELQEIPVRCSNPTPGLIMQLLGEETVNILIRAQGVETKSEQFEALVFCPAFYDEKNKKIRPGFHIKDKPVRILDKLKRTNITILRVIPDKVSMQFLEAAELPPVRNNREQGLQEHLVRP